MSTGASPLVRLSVCVCDSVCIQSAPSHPRRRKPDRGSSGLRLRSLCARRLRRVARYLAMPPHRYFTPALTSPLRQSATARRHISHWAMKSSGACLRRHADAGLPHERRVLSLRLHARGVLLYHLAPPPPRYLTALAADPPLAAPRLVCLSSVVRRQSSVAAPQGGPLACRAPNCTWRRGFGERVSVCVSIRLSASLSRHFGSSLRFAARSDEPHGGMRGMRHHLTSSRYRVASVVVAVGQRHTRRLGGARYARQHLLLPARVVNELHRLDMSFLFVRHVALESADVLLRDLAVELRGVGDHARAGNLRTATMFMRFSVGLCLCSLCLSPSLSLSPSFCLCESLPIPFPTIRLSVLACLCEYPPVFGQNCTTIGPTWPKLAISCPIWTNPGRTFSDASKFGQASTKVG